MKKYKNRDKAFIGTAISAVASIAGGLIGGAKRRREAKRQARIQAKNAEYQQNVQKANSLNQALAEYDDSYGEDFENRLMKLGGKKCYRNRKAWGGWGDVIGGAISGIGTIASAATDNPMFNIAGNAIGNEIGNSIKGSYTNRMIKQNEATKQFNATNPLPTINGINTSNYRNDLPILLPLRKRYGGRTKC